MSESKKIPVINNFYFTIIQNKPDLKYTAPEIRGYYNIIGVTGIITNHEMFKDGQLITTSEVVKIQDEKYIITYSGSKYLLGKPSKEYIENRTKENKPIIPTFIERV